jgi:EAL domain-containing protein (putative c-di-GMP-specific phosphodiesterase class I)
MTIPFESYAKLIRTIAPLVRKVLFYDGDSQPSWISDGMEEPELRGAVMQLMSERAPFEEDVASMPIGDSRETFILFAVRSEHGTLAGLMGVVCRTALAASEPGRSQLTRRLLAPVLDVYRHSVNQSAPAPKPAPQLASPKPTALVVAATPPTGDIYDHVLRQTATEIACSFAALVIPGDRLSRTCRISQNESDLSIHAAVQSCQAALFKWVSLRRQPTMVNRTNMTAPFKIAAVPVLDATDKVVGVMLLFRDRLAPDYTTMDLERACVSCGSLLANHATPSQIRSALADGNFRLYAQRISPLRRHSRSARFEVLLRMQNQNAIYTPESFMDVARTNRLMPEIDRWVVHNSLHALSSHAELLPDRNVEFCINVDEQSLTTPGFADFVVSELAECEVPADLLMFEVAEPTALEKQAAVESFADRVSAAGCKLSLDHFGARTGTLAALSRMHISSVKIDGPLVRDVTTNRRSESLLRDVASMTASMHIETVAGRVEQDSVREKLQTLGIDYAQGFALSPPRPVDEALAELEYLRRASGRRPVAEPMLITA